MIRGTIANGGAERVIGALWPDDDRSMAVLKAVSSPATTSSSSWAGALAANTVADFTANLGPASAASALIRLGLQVDLAGAKGVLVPGLINAAHGAAFIGEGAPIPVASLAVDGPTLTPHKVALIAGFTRETAECTAIEAIAGAVLREAATIALDAALFGTSAATTEASAGLRYGATTVAPAAGGGDTAMASDLGDLAAAVAPVAGTSIVFVASPGEAAKIKLRSTSFGFGLFATGALPAGTVMAVAVNAFVAAVDAVPEISRSVDALVHYEDGLLADRRSRAGASVAGAIRFPDRHDPVADGHPRLLGVAHERFRFGGCRLGRDVVRPPWIATMKTPARPPVRRSQPPATRSPGIDPTRTRCCAPGASPSQSRPPSLGLSSRRR